MAIAGRYSRVLNSYNKLVDDSGIVKLSKLPDQNLINVFDVALESGLISLSSAKKFDLAFVSGTQKTYRLMSDVFSVSDNWKEVNLSVSAATPPVGASYVQFSGSPLPSSTLKDKDNNDISISYSQTDLDNALYSGTVWKKAVRNGDFLRQEGKRMNADLLEIGTDAIGTEQEDSFQGHWHEGYTSSESGYQVNGKTVGYSSLIVSNQDRYSAVDAKSDRKNGSPRIGIETRSVNTAVCFWVRVA